MRSLLSNLILPCVLLITLPAHAALNTIVNPTLSTSVVDASVPTVSYTYNYLGQRVSKTVTQNTLPPTSVTTYYEYNDQGNLLGEYNASGIPLRQYVYLNGERVAMFDYLSGSKQTIYLANNHVGQMQYAWNSSGTIVDTRVQAPFGETASETPTGGLQIPVRFPGQIADNETGYSQNWNRDYDSSTGRYLQSDPIGLDGGINTYGYVLQNPVMYVDPYGLSSGSYTNSDGKKNRPITFPDGAPLKWPDGASNCVLWIGTTKTPVDCKPPKIKCKSDEIPSEDGLTCVKPPWCPIDHPDKHKSGGGPVVLEPEMQQSLVPYDEEKDPILKLGK